MSNYFNRGAAPNPPGHGNGYLHKAVPNASVSVSINGLGLPQPGTGFSDTYGGGGRPGIKLNSVTLEVGDSLGMVVRAEANFTCFTLGAFTSVKSTALKFGKPMSVSMGYVKGSGAGGKGISASNLMIYNFKWNLTKDNFFDVSVSGIGAITSALKASLASKGWTGTFKDGTADLAGADVPVNSIPSWIRFTAQGGGSQTDDQILGDAKGKMVEGVLIMKNPLYKSEEAAAPPDPAVTAEIDAKLATLPGGLPVSSPVLYYTSLSKIVELINKYYVPTIEVSDLAKGTFERPEFVLDDSAINANLISSTICSAEPFKVLLPGMANYGLSSTAPEETAQKFLVDQDAAPPAAVNGSTINCGNIMISANYLSQDLMGPANVIVPDTQTANKAAADTPKGETFTFETFFKKLFDGISYVTGGAVKLQLVSDHSANSNKILIIALHSGTNGSGAAVFNPFSGTQAIRQLDLGCAPASADAFAIAVKGPGNAGPAKWNGEGASGNSAAKSDGEAKAKELSNSGLTNANYSSDASKSLRDALAAIVAGASASDAINGKVAVTEAQFPLTFRATIQGHGGFKFGQRVTVPGIPGGGSFMVTKATHTVAENDWQTVVDAVWLGG